MAFWSKIPNPPNAPMPVACCAHTSSEIDKNLFIFGGWTGSKMMNDLYVLNTPTMRWNKPSIVGMIGQPRAGHSMVSVNNKLFIFGGADNGIFFNDLQVFDTNKMSWIQIYVTGTNPGARSRHTANLITFFSSPSSSPSSSSGKYILIFGGGDDRRLYNDVYVLNADNFQWTRLEPKGEGPSPRWGHTATIIDRKLYIFAGHDGTKRLNDLWILNIESLDNLEWSQPILSPDSTMPPARAGHTADPIGRKIFVYGGGDGKVLSDLYYFDVDQLTWSRMNGTSPGRCAHSSTAIDGKMYIFGGGNGTKCFRDMYIFDADQYIKSEEAKMARMKNKLKVKQKLESFLEQKAKTVQQRQSELEKIPSLINLNIIGWLQSIGMEKYITNFQKEEIDMDIIHCITEDHLKKLGIESIAARLTICSAIEKLTEEKASKSNVFNLESNLKEISKVLQMSVRTLHMATVNLNV